MLIRITTTCATVERAYQQGEIVEVTDELAAEFIRANIAEAVQQPVAEETAVVNPVRKATSWRKPKQI